MMLKQIKDNSIINNITKLFNGLKSLPLFKLIEEHPIIIVLGIASILRFWGIWHGYPFSFYPDEQHFVNRSISFGSGDLNPHWFHKPAFLMYILFFEYGLFFLIGKIIGIFSTVDSFAIYYFQSSWPFILIGRITVSIFGISTIFVVYKIGKEFYSKTVGLYCAVFLTLSYGHIFCGQDVKADVPSTFFTLISMYFLLKVVSANYNTKYYVLAGLFAGLGTATKYYSIVVLPCILVASLYEIITKRNILLFKKYIYSLLSYWGIYFIVSPYNFLDPMGRRWTFNSIVRIYNKISPFKVNPFSRIEGTPVVEYGDRYYLDSIVNYIQVLISTEGVGIIIGVMFISSVFYLFFRPKVNKILLVSFPAIFSVVSIVINPSYTEPRHQLIIYPFLSIGAGIFIYEVSARLKNSFKVNIILSFLLVFPLVSIIKNNIYNARPDTRTITKYWIESNIPCGSKIIIEEDLMVLKNSKKNLMALHEESKKFKTGQFTAQLDKYYYYQMKDPSEITYDIKEIRHIWWRDKEISKGEAAAITEFDKDFANPIKKVGLNSYESYKKNGYEYVVTGSTMYTPYISPDKPKGKNFPDYQAFYDDLFSKGKLVKEFNPDELKLSGPTVKIFRIN